MTDATAGVHRGARKRGGVAAHSAGAAAQPYAAGQRFMTMTFTDALAQTISAERAAGLVKSGMWLDYGTSLCQPDVFDKAVPASTNSRT
jgi:hypothetical protein